ncbi:MAG: alpha-amylase [Promethearchaeota archaeon]
MGSTAWPPHPRIFQVNAWTFLRELSDASGEVVTLDLIPAEVYDEKFKFYDAVWLMGVWERSPASREIALSHPDLQVEFRNSLPDFTPGDVVGSPYAVHRYRVDPHLGGPSGLSAAREELEGRGKLLVLDFVPNHVAVDHPWTVESPGCLLQGDEQDLEAHPAGFFRAGGKIFAHGRDPYFPPWTDTAQVNAFSGEAREGVVQILKSIARQCDGVRCDMAMLPTNAVFERTWGTRGGAPPPRDFWDDIIPRVREEFPELVMVAEVYWNMEWDLQQQGFDYTYDKRLYDRLLHERAEVVRAHLHHEWDYARKLLRFTENHDEALAVEAFGFYKSKAAAVVALTLPGARLVHEGQPLGRKVKLPVQLGRRPAEPDDPGVVDFYSRLLPAIPSGRLVEGRWKLCGLRPVSGDDNSFSNLVAHCWTNGDERLLVVVNLGGSESRAHAVVPDFEFRTGDWVFEDKLNHEVYVYHAEELDLHGLYVNLPPWQSHIFEVKRA